jgi:endogenous inhibitor of DNA gyrase (YacG/DUF329 family)
MQKQSYCPICHGKVHIHGTPDEINMKKKLLPFCSSSCKSKDLSNWVFESYRIPLTGVSAVESSEEDEMDDLSRDRSSS